MAFDFTWPHLSQQTPRILVYLMESNYGLSSVACTLPGSNPCPERDRDGGPHRRAATLGLSTPKSALAPTCGLTGESLQACNADSLPPLSNPGDTSLLLFSVKCQSCIASRGLRCPRPSRPRKVPSESVLQAPAAKHSTRPRRWVPPTGRHQGKARRRRAPLARTHNAAMTIRKNAATTE